VNAKLFESEFLHSVLIKGIVLSWNHVYHALHVAKRVSFKVIQTVGGN